MDLLTAVNLILPALGEHPVTSISVKHPTLAVIIPQVDAQRRAFLLRGWWFNEYKTTLYPDSEGGIALPTGLLSFIPDSVNCAVRGGALFNTDTLDFLWDSSVTGSIIMDLEFDELPDSAAQYVMYSALVTAYVTDIGLEQVVQVWGNAANAAQASVTAEHLRNKRYSTLKSARFGRLSRALRG